MFIQLIEVVDKEQRRPLFINVNQIAYVEADTPDHYGAIYFAGGFALDRTDDASYLMVTVEESYEAIKSKILAVTIFAGQTPPVATT